MAHDLGGPDLRPWSHAVGFRNLDAFRAVVIEKRAWLRYWLNRKGCFGMACDSFGIDQRFGSRASSRTKFTSLCGPSLGRLLSRLRAAERPRANYQR